MKKMTAKQLAKVIRDIKKVNKYGGMIIVAVKDSENELHGGVAVLSLSSDEVAGVLADATMRILTGDGNLWTDETKKKKSKSKAKPRAKKVV